MIRRSILLTSSVLAVFLAFSSLTQAQMVYWNVFNEEGESAVSSVLVTYSSLDDMLNDTNRTEFGVPNTFGLGHNIVGSGSDGSSFWNVFNQEGESAASSAIVTYDSFADMLNDTNRSSFGVPDTLGFGNNVVGSGSDGSTYWNVFNQEDESAASSVIVTYNSLIDMLNDTNRAEFGIPNSVGFGHNIVGSGAFFLPPNGGNSVPEPATVVPILLLLTVLLGGRILIRSKR